MLYFIFCLPRCSSARHRLFFCFCRFAVVVLVVGSFARVPILVVLVFAVLVSVAVFHVVMVIVAVFSLLYFLLLFLGELLCAF